MPRTADHATKAAQWLAWAEQKDPTEPSTMALLAIGHGVLAVAAYLGAARVRPAAAPFVPDPHKDADEAAIDRARAKAASDAERGIQGLKPDLVIYDEMADEDQGWSRVETHYVGDGHDHEGEDA